MSTTKKSVRADAIMAHLIGHIKAHFKPNVSWQFGFCRNAGGVCVVFEFPEDITAEVVNQITINGYEAHDFSPITKTHHVD